MMAHSLDIGIKKTGARVTLPVDSSIIVILEVTFSSKLGIIFRGSLSFKDGAKLPIPVVMDYKKPAVIIRITFFFVPKKKQ